MYSLIALLRRPENGFGVLIVFALVAAQSLMGPMDLHVFEKRVGLDSVRMTKILLSLLMLLLLPWGILRFPAVRTTLASAPSLMLGVLLLMTLLGATSGINSSSIPCTIFNSINFVFIVIALVLLQVRAFSFAILLGAACSTLYAFYLFYLVPERGVFLEPISLTEFVPRLGGVGHPNSVARSTVLGFVLSVYLLRTKEIPLLLGVGLLVIFGYGTMLTQSRTATIAGLLAIALLYSDKLKSRTVVAAATIGAVGLILALFSLFAAGQEDQLIDSVIDKITKSGNATELMTGTGRTQIWAESIRLIGMRPLIGYGFNAGPVLLFNYSQSNHNSIIYATMSGGLLAGILMICLQLQVAWNTISCPNLLIRGVSAYLCISCMIEDTIFENTPGPGTILWYACILAPVLIREPSADESQ
jgi:exopolysaccharide production protein ExoQ